MKKKNKTRGMQTFIMFWNPEVSNFSNADQSILVKSLRQGLKSRLNWSMCYWQKVRPMDRFYIVRCGMSNPADDGVIASGYIVCEPYLDEGRSELGRKVRYVDLAFDVVIDCNCCAPLSSLVLDKYIQDFDWHGGYSDRWLDEISSMDLSGLWVQYASNLWKDRKTRKKVYYNTWKFG